MINEETNNKVKSIKRSFRLLMNGVASHSMREKGLSYKINWGIQFSDIKNLAGEYGKDYQLAVELWKENVRVIRRTEDQSSIRQTVSNQA